MTDQDFLNAGGRNELIGLVGDRAAARIVMDMLRPNQVTKHDERTNDHGTD